MDLAWHPTKLGEIDAVVIAGVCRQVSLGAPQFDRGWGAGRQVTPKYPPPSRPFDPSWGVQNPPPSQPLWGWAHYLRSPDPPPSRLISFLG
eukprot:600161-Prorocentrum_minimum.AAC.1